MQLLCHILTCKKPIRLDTQYAVDAFHHHSMEKVRFYCSSGHSTWIYTKTLSEEDNVYSLASSDREVHC